MAEIIDSKKQTGTQGGRVATIGFFDGVHRGHLHLIDQVLTIARRRAASSLIVTFDSHPARLLDPTRPLSLLTPTDQKLALLRQTDIDDIAVMPFTESLANMTAREFMTDTLRDQLGVTVLVIGYDHRFGHGRTEGFDDYVRIGNEIGIDVIRATELDIALHCSSSAIRHAIAECDMDGAKAMLGRPYSLQGHVVSGHHVGTSLGFPTANLQPDSADSLIPPSGVYGVEVDTPYGRRLGMCNIGTRPTIRNGSERSIEVNIFDFCHDIYSAAITVHFMQFLRKERRFESTEALVRQLKDDKARIKLASETHTTPL